MKINLNSDEDDLSLKKEHEAASLTSKNLS